MFVPVRNFMAEPSASLKLASKVWAKASCLNVAHVPAAAHDVLALV